MKQYTGDKFVGLLSEVKPSHVEDGAEYFTTDTVPPQHHLKVNGSWICMNCTGTSTATTSGTSGTSGQGTVGPIGPPGPTGQGIQGIPGNNGTSGINGTSGTSGTSVEKKAYYWTYQLFDAKYEVSQLPTQYSTTYDALILPQTMKTYADGDEISFSAFTVKPCGAGSPGQQYMCDYNYTYDTLSLNPQYKWIFKKVPQSLLTWQGSIPVIKKLIIDKPGLHVFNMLYIQDVYLDFDAHGEYDIMILNDKSAGIDFKVLNEHPFYNNGGMIFGVPASITDAHNNPANSSMWQDFKSKYDSDFTGYNGTSFCGEIKYHHARTHAFVKYYNPMGPTVYAQWDRLKYTTVNLKFGLYRLTLTPDGIYIMPQMMVGAFETNVTFPSTALISRSIIPVTQ